MKKLLFFAMLPLLAVFTACAYHYEGTEMPALEKNAKVQMFVDEEKVPDDCAKMGVLTFTTAPGLRATQVYNIIREQARKRGANGFLIRKMENIPAGTARMDQLQNGTAPGWDCQNNTVTSAAAIQNTIEYSSGKVEEKPVYKFKVDVVLLRCPEPAK